MNDIFVRLIDLPPAVHGFVMEDPAGDYNIYIREQDPEHVRLRTLAHEHEHIRRGHLHDDTKSVAQKEAEAENRPVGARYSAHR